MSTIRSILSIVLLNVGGILISCSNEELRPQLKVEFLKGDNTLSCQCDTSDWHGSLPQDQSFELCFKNEGMAVISDGTNKILLPKRDKPCYSYQDIVEEFERQEDKVMQDYFSFLLSSIQEKQKTEHHPVGGVSRGIITMLKPDESCAVWQDTLSFEWQTELTKMDTLAMIIQREDGTPVYHDSIPAQPPSLKIPIGELADPDGSTLKWVVFQVDGPTPKSKAFTIADKDAIAQFRADIKEIRSNFAGFPDYVVQRLLAEKSHEAVFCK